MQNRRSRIKRLAGWGALAAATARAAPPVGKRRLGVLLFDNAERWDSLPPLLLKELARLGWVEGTNLDVQWRYANGDPAALATLAAQLIKSGVDAILTRGTPSTRALQRTTTTVPILTGVGDPVGFGFARTLAQPRGNISGISYATAEASPKQVELLRAIAPRLSTLLVVWPSDRGAITKELTRVMEDAAREMNVTPTVALVGNAADLRAALAADRARGEFAAFVSGLATKIEPKALAVFRGDKPAQIPFEFPTRSEFVVNLATARSLGLTIPPALRLRADALVQ